MAKKSKSAKNRRSKGKQVEQSTIKKGEVIIQNALIDPAIETLQEEQRGRSQ